VRWRGLGLALGLVSTMALAGQVVDDKGRTVTVPDQPRHIADAWFAHHALLMTLGAGDRIVATVNHTQRQPWMFTVQPSLNQALTVDGTAFNVESLLAAKVDLVFASTGDRHALAYEQAGIAVVYMGFNDLPGLKHSLLTSAQALGSPEALARAQAYDAYLDQQVETIRQRLQGLPAEQRPRVLHIASLKPLKVDGAGTLIDDWIGLAGGRNAATGLTGNLQVVNAEQVLAWQPDVVILAADAGSLDQVPLLKQLHAVTSGHLLRNPAGVFPWDRYGTEIALQLPWAAQQLHPALFQNVQMGPLTQAFYQRFFDYPLTAGQAASILQGDGPAGP